MKYISMKIDPNGKMPAVGITKCGLAYLRVVTKNTATCESFQHGQLQHAQGVIYHAGVGIGRGTRFTRQGKLGFLAQCLPSSVPTTHNGKDTKIHSASILSMAVNGMALDVS